MTEFNIGTLNERSLHSDLKDFICQEGDDFEVAVDGYIIDIVRQDTLIEIQTANFASIKTKINDLVTRYPINLVYPIAREKWINKLPSELNPRQSRRKSPKRGRPIDIFNELVAFPEIFQQENFTLQLLMIQEEEIRRFIGKRRWRSKGWSTEERKLLNVLETHHFNGLASLLRFIPETLPDEFTTKELAYENSISLRLAQKMAYCLRHLGIFELVGKRSRSYLYRLNQAMIN